MEYLKKENSIHKFEVKQNQNLVITKTLNLGEEKLLIRQKLSNLTLHDKFINLLMIDGKSIKAYNSICLTRVITKSHCCTGQCLRRTVLALQLLSINNLWRGACAKSCAELQLNASYFFKFLIFLSSTSLQSMMTKLVLWSTYVRANVHSTADVAAIYRANICHTKRKVCTAQLAKFCKAVLLDDMGFCNLLEKIPAGPVGQWSRVYVTDVREPHLVHFMGTAWRNLQSPSASRECCQHALAAAPKPCLQCYRTMYMKLWVLINMWPANYIGTGRTKGHGHRHIALVRCLNTK